MYGVWDGHPQSRVVGLQRPLLSTVCLGVFASSKPPPVTAYGLGGVRAPAHVLCSPRLLAQVQMEKHASDGACSGWPDVSCGFNL